MNVSFDGAIFEFVHWYFISFIPDKLSVTFTFVFWLFWYVLFPFVSNVTIGFSLSIFVISLFSPIFALTPSTIFAIIVPFALYVSFVVSVVLYHVFSSKSLFASVSSHWNSALLSSVKHLYTFVLATGLPVVLNRYVPYPSYFISTSFSCL